MKKQDLLIAGVLVFAVQTLFAVVPPSTALVSAPRTITVVSESEVSAPADLAVVSMQFAAYGWTVQKSRKKTDQLVQDFMDKLAKRNVVPAKTTVGDAKLTPSTQFNRDLQVNVPSNFLVNRKVVLEIEDIPAIDQILDASISVGSFSMDSVRLTVKDKDALKQKAFEKAMADGKKKAEGIAKSMNASVDQILDVEELESNVSDVSLIQSMDAASQAATNAGQNPQAVTSDQQAPDEKEPSSPYFDQIRSASRLKITFSTK